ncbi:MAG: AAA family ATPase, partial [Mycobacteriaceae bacterium]|nr:AAA family ATPase [Mycobacteriaceae bacterium]
ESQAGAAAETPESRPRRVALPYARIRRLQQMEPAPPVADLPAAPEPSQPDTPTDETADAALVEKPSSSADELPVAPEPKATPESVEWVSEALTRLEWQYDSLLAESLVKPDAPSGSADEPEIVAAEWISAEADLDPVAETPSVFAGAARPQFEPEVAEVLPEPESDVEHPVESVAPVVVSVAAFEAEPDFQLWEEPELTEAATAPPEPEPAPVDAEPQWEPPPAPGPDPAVEVSTEQDWTLEVEPESTAVESEPVAVETEPLPVETLDVESQTTAKESESGELDDIELRAAALLEQMAAKRAQATAAPQEPEVDLIADDARDAKGPDGLPAEPTDEFESPAAEEHQEAVQWLPTDLVTAAQQSQVEPETDDQRFGETVVARTESRDAEPPTQELQESAPAAEEQTKKPRRPAPPPWQTPSSAMAAEIEDVVMDAPVAHHEPPAPESHEPRTQPGPLINGPQPPTPPAQARRQPRPGARPPWPPPPPPGPFPPPPWWPGPPPGQRVRPSARPAASAPPRRTPQPTPPPGRPQPPVGGPPPGYRPLRMPPSIDEAEITNPDRFAPPSGWRRAVHKATGGHVNPGASRKERQQGHLLDEIRQPIVGDFRIAVLSIKGGVGKTTTTFGLGSALATVRHDRVIAVDANPDRGTLGERVGDLSTRSTVRDLLSDPNINRYADVRNHTLMATSRLEVLASEQDPAVSEVFGADDYRRTVDILRHYYNIILTDCGTGIMHSAMSAVLDLAHTIVLVSSPAIDAARSASATLDWLIQHGHSGLVREAHVVLSASRPGSAALKLDKVYEHFQSRCRSIHLIPFDPHLAEGADVDFGRLNPATRQAYLELAGSVAENFGRLRAPLEKI